MSSPPAPQATVGPETMSSPDPHSELGIGVPTGRARFAKVETNSEGGTTPSRCCHKAAAPAAIGELTDVP